MEAVLHTLGDEDTPEVKSLQGVLKKAKVAAQGIPVGVQLEECQKFVARCEKRIAALDVERSKELERLEEGNSNLERLRLIRASHKSHLFQIHHQWSNCEDKWPICSSNWARCGCTTMRQAVAPKERTVRLREEFVPMCIVQWMQDRQGDLQDASRTGNASEVTSDSRDSIRHGPIFRVAFQRISPGRGSEDRDPSMLERPETQDRVVEP